MEQETVNKLINFAENFIDEMCETVGVFTTISILHKTHGFSKYELVYSLKFDPNDVEEVIPSEGE